MSDPVGESAEPEGAFGVALGRLGPVLLAALDALEQAFRRLHPPDFPRLQASLAPVRDALVDAHAGFLAAPVPESMGPFREDLAAAAGLVSDALSRFVEPGEAGAMGALRAMHEHARAQARLYPLRRALPPISAYFAEAFRHGDLDALEASSGAAQRVGLFRSGEPGARGGFDLYVPESYDGRESWPLVVALHGGSGSGEDFLWSWLREARSRRLLLLAPTSRETTWSLAAPERDGEALCRQLEWVASQWRVDRSRVLLTGLSDGATMTLLVGLAEGNPFTHLAPVSGVLHPQNFANGNLDRASGKKIHLVHGALDWMFPIGLAREAARVLEGAGAELVFRELPDLSHTYPREENQRIIEWLDPRRGAFAIEREGAGDRRRR